MNKEFYKMQKTAGLITESQYQEKMEENSSSETRSYNDLLNIIKQYEGFEDYVGSFKKAFQGKDTITKDAWMEWSGTLDGGYDQEGYAEKHWKMAGKGKTNEISNPGSDDDDKEYTKYKRLDQETWMGFVDDLLDTFGNGHTAYDESEWTKAENKLIGAIANVLNNAGYDIS